MKCTLIGVQELDFETSDKNKIDGVKLHLAIPDGNVYGSKAASNFVPRNVFESFEVSVKELVEFIGNVVDVEYNEKAKVVGLSV